MNEQRFDRGAIGNSAAASVNMKARSDLTNAIRERVESWKVTQATAAKQLGISQPRINDLLRGRIDKFSLDALMKLAPRAGLAVELRAAPLTIASPEVGAPALAVNKSAEQLRRARPRRQRRIPFRKAKQGTGGK